MTLPTQKSCFGFLDDFLFFSPQMRGWICVANVADLLFLVAKNNVKKVSSVNAKFTSQAFFKSFLLAQGE